MTRFVTSEIFRPSHGSAEWQRDKTAPLLARSVDGGVLALGYTERSPCLSENIVTKKISNKNEGITQ
jgi:hypothetical protein